MARTDAHAATLITSDVDERDQPFLTGERTAEGFFRVRNGHGAVRRPRAGLRPVLRPAVDGDRPPRTWRVAREFAEAIKAAVPGPDAGLQLLAVVQLARRTWMTDTIAKFQRELGAMGYKFQFITLAGFHALNQPMFDLARGYAEEGMPAYVRLQDAEFAAEAARLHRHPAPARGRHRLLRPGDLGDHAGRRHGRAGRLDRERAVRQRALSLRSAEARRAPWSRTHPPPA